MLVDDRSTDLSYELAKAYERTHPDRMKAIRLDEKKYAGGARNAGIDYPADCEYIYFLDGDDYLYAEDTLELLHRDALAAGMPDMLLGSFALDTDGRVWAVPPQEFRPDSDRLASSAWNSSSSKIQRASKVERFLENCMRGEDTYQWLRMLDKGATCAQVGYPLFAYRQHQASATHGPAFQNDRPVFVKALKDMLPGAKNRWVAASIKRRCGL